MDDVNDAPGWSRQELNLRLTQRRLAQLQAIASRLPGRPTPTDAIDAALTQASETEGVLLARIEEIEACIEIHSAERRAEAGRIEVAVKATERSLADLHALILTAAADPDGV